MSNVLNNLKARRDQEEGFTLIELMVVVLIIAILIAIAIPTFLGARERAQDRAAQSSLRNALTAAKTAYTDASLVTTPSSPRLPIHPAEGDRAEPDLQGGRHRVRDQRHGPERRGGERHRHRQAGLVGGGALEVGHVLLHQGHREWRRSRDQVRIGGDLQGDGGKGGATAAAW